jgi:hypothetical protein
VPNRDNAKLPELCELNTRTVQKIEAGEITIAETQIRRLLMDGTIPGNNLCVS